MKVCENGQCNGACSDGHMHASLKHIASGCKGLSS